jgi:hypothetical protein
VASENKSDKTTQMYQVHNSKSEDLRFFIFNKLNKQHNSKNELKT